MQHSEVWTKIIVIFLLKIRPRQNIFTYLDSLIPTNLSVRVFQQMWILYSVQKTVTILTYVNAYNDITIYTIG